MRLSSLCGAVTISVKFGVRLMCFFSLSVISGKCSLVICPFVVLSHWCCHLAVDFFLAFLAHYFTFWDSVEAYFAVVGCFFDKFIRQFVSAVSRVRFYPCKLCASSLFQGQLSYSCFLLLGIFSFLFGVFKG